MMKGDYGCPANFNKLTGPPSDTLYSLFVLFRSRSWKQRSLIRCHGQNRLDSNGVEIRSCSGGHTFTLTVDVDGA